MKNFSRNITILSVVLLCSCDSELTDLNNNPSFPSDVAAITLIPNIQQEAARGLQFDSRFVGKYTQYFTNATANNEWDLQGFTLSSDAGGEIWRTVYFGQGLNLSNLITKAEEEKKIEMLGFGKAMRAWGYQTATDYHGDLINFDQVFTPRLTFDFSPQQRAYAEVIKLADEAIAILSPIPVNAPIDQAFARADLIYGGRAKLWEKFAYGIKARNLNSQVQKAGYTATMAIRVIQFCDLSLISSAEDATIKFNGSIGADSNFFGPTRNNMSTFRQSDFLVRAMNGSIFTGAIDPRMSRIISPSGATSIVVGQPLLTNPLASTYTFAGNPLNFNVSTANTVTRIPNLWGTFLTGTAVTPGRYLFRDRADFPIMTYAEIQFMKAEAAFYLNNKPMALQAYINGINASMDLVNRYTVPSAIFPLTEAISSAERATYLANVNVVPTANNLTLSQIMMQKYIALFGFGTMETWVDMRKYRYDVAIYPTIAYPTPLFAANSGKLAYRVRPRFNSVYVWNFAAIQAIGADVFDYHTKEMWFMQP